jgi:hypothetical protein
MASLALALIGAAVLIWFFLRFWESRRTTASITPRSGLRLAVAAIGILTVLFSGGCGLIIGIGELMRPPSGAADDFMSWEVVAVFSLPPFLIGLFIWWLAMRRQT